MSIDKRAGARIRPTVFAYFSQISPCACKKRADIIYLFAMKEYLPVLTESVSTKELFDYNPLVLSSVGDGVHTLFLRCALVKTSPYRNDMMHALTSKFACAPSQADAAKKILPLLTKEERAIFNKAKNGKINTVPKHATFYQYQLATAFEAVVGYLYLSAQSDRLAELFDIIYGETVPFGRDKDTQMQDINKKPLEEK